MVETVAAFLAFLLGCVTGEELVDFDIGVDVDVDVDVNMESKSLLLSPLSCGRRRTSSSRVIGS